MKLTMKLIFLLLMLVGASVQAQTQPIFTAPANGQPVQVFAAVDYHAVTTTSIIMDMSNSQGVLVSIVTDQNNCTFLPVVYTYQSATTTFTSKSTQTPTDAVNAMHIDRVGAANTGSIEDSYVVAPLYKYVEFKLAAGTAVSGGSNTCRATVTVTPLAFVPFVISADAKSVIALITATPALIFAATNVYGPFSRQSVTLQNQSVGVIFCDFTPLVTTTAFAVSLKACSTAYDGTGGSWTLANFAGPVYCVTSAASVTACTTNCKVSAYTD